MKKDQIKLSSEELQDLRSHLPYGALAQAARELGMHYNGVARIFREGNKFGWYDSRVIKHLRNMTK